MRELIERGLMFGNLIEVSSPALVERYNRALRHLTGKETKLTDFHIDISGFSPEIGFELNDDLYLNHAGVNRQFILLTTDQKTAPLLNAKFSTSRSILRHFIEDNEAQLFALTARDAVAGELVNTVYSLDRPEQLLDIRQITIEADTTEATVRQAAELGRLIDRFKREPDAWYDDVLIAEMISLAKRTGDVTRNPVRLREMRFQQENYWTAHFSGTYLFRGVEHPGVISRSPLPAQIMERQYAFNDRNRIARFLEDNGLAEPIVVARGIDAAAVLRQKMEFVVADVAASLGEDLSGATRSDLRRLARNHHDALPQALHGLAALLRWAESGGEWPEISSDHDAYFYTLRAADHPDADLVNQLLADLAPMDFRQLFICHKERFYELYAGWPGTKQRYVAEFLEREYQVDKVAAREALFGREEPMEEPAPAKSPWDRSEDLIDLVGPWGAVRRG